MRPLLFLTIVCSTFGLIFTITIDSDVDEITNLLRDLKKYSPEIARRFTQTICQMMSQCCPQFQYTFASKILLGDTKDLTNQCFSDKGASNLVANFLSCSPLIDISKMAADLDLLKYYAIITKEEVQDTEDVKSIVEVCSEKELHAIICDWNSPKEEKTCLRKLLQKLTQQGEKNYTKEVQKMKEQDTELVNLLKKAFHN